MDKLQTVEQIAKQHIQLDIDWVGTTGPKAAAYKDIYTKGLMLLSGTVVSGADDLEALDTLQAYIFKIGNYDTIFDFSDFATDELKDSLQDYLEIAQLSANPGRSLAVLALALCYWAGLAGSGALQVLPLCLLRVVEYVAL